MPPLSIIIPVLDEAKTIGDTLAALAPLRRRGAEIIVADGESRDDTLDVARPMADGLTTSTRGRAAQMNAGAAFARGEILLFLHADTRLPENADGLVADGLRQSGATWGRFDVKIEGHSPVLPLVAMAMNLRSALTGIATGDQAIFMTRAAFDAVGSFPDIALMEDVEMSKRLKRMSWPLRLRAPVTTSGRRWDENGPLRTIALMWKLRLAYFLGTEPAVLARHYGYREN
jgi:rSAM/selenodomain-associated transferase 2